MRQEIIELQPALARWQPRPSWPKAAREVISLASRRFRVLEGGLGEGD